MVKEIRPEANIAGYGFLTNVNGTLFFKVNDGIHGSELWKSNATVQGTKMVKDIATQPEIGYG